MWAEGWSSTGGTSTKGHGAFEHHFFWHWEIWGFGFRWWFTGVRVLFGCDIDHLWPEGSGPPIYEDTLLTKNLSGAAKGNFGGVGRGFFLYHGFRF